jgi:hypothetical protein
MHKKQNVWREKEIPGLGNTCLPDVKAISRVRTMVHGSGTSEYPGAGWDKADSAASAAREAVIH